MVSYYLEWCALWKVFGRGRSSTDEPNAVARLGVPRTTWLPQGKNEYRLGENRHLVFPARFIFYNVLI